MSDNQHTNRTMSRRSLLGACATAGTVYIAGCTSDSLEAETTVTQEYDRNGISRLEVEGINGDIEIRDEQRETVHVEAKKQATDEDGLDLITLRDERAGERLSLTVNTEDTGFLDFASPQLRVDLTVTVPEGLQVGAETTNGAVDIETTDAESVSADTTNGDITISLAEASDIQANSTNGDVAVILPRTAEPSVSFETTNGEIDVNGVSTLSPQSDSASNRPTGNGTHQVTVTTTNGNLSIQSKSS